MGKINFEKWLVKIDRISAWILLFAFILYMISGYGLTKGLISRSLSRSLHIQYLPLVIIITFALHVGLALRMTFIRWQIWNKISKFLLILGCLLFLGFFVYVELFYSGAPRVEKPAPIVPEIETETLPEEELQAVSIIEEPIIEDGLRVFTREELSYYNGQGGRPAYVAVDGIVYDNTEVFKGGEHYSHFAGRELTDAFYSYHVIKEIEKYPVVGRLAE